MTAPVGVIGLGIMGSAYASHLLDAGVPAIGYDVEPEALERFGASGGTIAASPRDVGERCALVITALASVAALEAAYLGDQGLVRSATAGSVIVDHSTFALADKERVREALAARDVTVLDAPVSGTGAQAAVRDLTVFASGDRAAYDAAHDAMTAYARDVRYVGEFGTGSKLKYLANLLVTIHNLSTAEAIVLGEKAGLDPELIIASLNDSAATSRMFQVRAPMIASRNYQPAAMKMDVYDKDLHIIDDFARATGAPTPLFSQSVLFYTAALSNGHAKDDTAAIAEVLRAMAGLTAER